MHAHALKLQEPTGGTRLVSLVKWPAQPGFCAIKSASADGTSEVANVS